MTLGWDLRAGQRVIAMSPQLATGAGTWADLVALPAGLVAPAPAKASLAEAATLPLAASWAGGVAGAGRARARRRETRLLVTGGAGAVGGFAVRLGAARALTTPAQVPARGYDAVLDTIGAPVADSVRDSRREADQVAERQRRTAERGAERRHHSADEHKRLAIGGRDRPGVSGDGETGTLGTPFTSVRHPKVPRQRRAPGAADASRRGKRPAAGGGAAVGRPLEYRHPAAMLAIAGRAER